MLISAKQAMTVYRNAKRLYAQEEVEAAMDHMGVEITHRMMDSNPIALCVMNGGLVPAGQLLTRLDFALQVDYIHATRYRGKRSGGNLHWVQRHNECLKGRTLLIIDDILDEGITLAAIVDACRQQGAEEVLSAVLVEKQHDRSNGFRADFVGLKAEDKYLFGYGMDYKGYLRNAPGIFAVSDEESPPKF